MSGCKKKLSPPGEVALSATVYRSNASGARIKLNKETKNVSRYAQWKPALTPCSEKMRQ